MSYPVLPQLEYDKIVDFCLELARPKGNIPGYIKVERKRVPQVGTSITKAKSVNAVPELIDVYIGKTAPIGISDPNTNIKWLCYDVGNPFNRMFHYWSGSQWVPTSDLAAVIATSAITPVIPPPTNTDGTGGSVRMWVVPSIVSGQTTFILPVTPVTSATTSLLVMNVNGIDYTETTSAPLWFTRVGTQVTWSNQFSLSPTDTVIFKIPT